MIEEATIDNVADIIPICFLTDYIINEDDPLFLEAMKILKEKHGLTKDDICIKSFPPAALAVDPLWDAQHNNATYLYLKRKPT